jgi:hypothetical protein
MRVRVLEGNAWATAQQQQLDGSTSDARALVPARAPIRGRTPGLKPGLLNAPFM